MNESTKNTIIAVILTAILGGIGQLISQGFVVSRHLDNMEIRLSTIEKARTRPDPWTGTDMYLWTLQVKEKNPSLALPTPKHIEP